MKENNYWHRMYGAREQAFIEGVLAGIEAYAYMRDGIYYVGTTGKTLKEAIQDVRKGLEKIAKNMEEKEL